MGRPVSPVRRPKPASPPVVHDLSTGLGIIADDYRRSPMRMLRRATRFSTTSTALRCRVAGGPGSGAGGPHTGMEQRAGGGTDPSAEVTQATDVWARRVRLAADTGARDGVSASARRWKTLHQMTRYVPVPA